MLIDRWENEGGAVRERKSSTGRGAAKARKGTILRRILVPIDFSPESLETLRFAKLLGTRFGARLHLLHVVSPPVISPARPVMIPQAYSDEAIAVRALQGLKNWRWNCHSRSAPIPAPCAAARRLRRVIKQRAKSTRT